MYCLINPRLGRLKMKRYIFRFQRSINLIKLSLALKVSATNEKKVGHPCLFPFPNRYKKGTPMESLCAFGIV